MKISMVYLYDIYAPLLNERQREVLELYYNEDQSLAEISENVGITRQGVRDCIVKSEALLKSYEEALRLHERLEGFKQDMDALSELARKNGAGEDIISRIALIKEKAF